MQLLLHSWKPAIEMPRKYKFSYFQKRAPRSNAIRIVLENLTNSIKSGKCRNIASLIKTHYNIDKVLRARSLVKNPYFVRV